MIILDGVAKQVKCKLLETCVLDANGMIALTGDVVVNMRVK